MVIETGKPIAQVARARLELGVGHQLAVDHVGQLAAQAAHRLHRGLSGPSAIS